MEGYELTPTRVRQEAPTDQPGFYRLGNAIDGRFYTAYVGRSDSSLQNRLRKHVQNGWYTHFIPRPTETAEEAYFLECLFFHLEQRHISNVRHPACPGGSDLECPYCNHERRLAANPIISVIP